MICLINGFFPAHFMRNPVIISKIISFLNNLNILWLGTSVGRDSSELLSAAGDVSDDDSFFCLLF